MPSSSASASSGSPPRAWGRPDSSIATVRPWRFTPTRVGTTNSSALNNAGKAVHPHARGDDINTLNRAQKGYGSPPRAWGRLPNPIPRRSEVRFTPTRVGTTSRDARRLHRRPVHPHARGDDERTHNVTARRCGSPPRAWGRLQRSHAAGRSPRFTPTRVGTTLCGSAWRTRPSVHPHARGDDAGRYRRVSAEFGSPPRAWGRRAMSGSVSVPARFTPTRVGTTSGPRVPPRRRAVHPHARGDDAAIVCQGVT